MCSSSVQFSRELGIGIVAYSPLGRGFFSGGAELIQDLTSDDYRKVCISGTSLKMSPLN